ncbi:hypothetical protein KA977_07745 [Candidatus Dependentiae bacterium]|nr:hypothetical protein [Candidatus Dependentiae bacterium]
MNNINIMIVCFNELFKKKVLEYIEKYNFEITNPLTISEALQEYISQKPFMIFIDPFFVEQTIQGIDILIQLKKNNQLLAAPVKFIGMTQNINASTEKILKDSCDYYFSEKNIHHIDAILKDIIESGGTAGKQITITETSRFVKDLSVNPIKTLTSDIDYKELNEYIKLIEEYNKEVPGTDQEKIKDEKRNRLTKLIKGFWKFYTEIAKKFVKTNENSIETLAFLRFRSILTKDWLSINALDAIIDNIKKTAQFEKTKNVFYADEWLKLIYNGIIPPTYNDILVQEFRRVKGFHNRLKNLNTNSEENYYNSLAMFLGITYFENLKKDAKKNTDIDFDTPKSENEILEIGKQLLFENEILEMFKALTNTCVGAMGNKQPVLSIFSDEDMQRRIVNKNDIIKIINDVEKIDPQLFVRIRLNDQKKFTEFKIIPYFILVPCSAQNAICWDPWHNSNKRTSPGRVAIPILPENPLSEIVLEALGSLRWRTAKEVADIYWMEEGLTGYYYQYWEAFRDKIDPETKESYVSSKSSLEESFVSDYCKWIKGESKGQLKLKKEVREIFWLNMPFSDEIKNNLRGRGQIYEDLLLKDGRRAKSRFTKK